MKFHFVTPRSITPITLTHVIGIAVWRDMHKLQGIPVNPATDVPVVSVVQVPRPLPRPLSIGLALWWFCFLVTFGGES